MPKCRIEGATSILLRGVRVSTEKKQARKCSLLIVLKGRHRYILKYNTSRLTDLFDVLMDYAQDEAYNLNNFDALALIDRIRGRKPGASVITLNESDPFKGKELKLGDIADINSGDDSIGEF